MIEDRVLGTLVGQQRVGGVIKAGIILPTHTFGCSIPRCEIQEDDETATAVERIPNQPVEPRITKLNLQGEAHFRLKFCLGQRHRSNPEAS